MIFAGCMINIDFTVQIAPQINPVFTQSNSSIFRVFAQLKLGKYSESVNASLCRKLFHLTKAILFALLECTLMDEQPHRLQAINQTILTPLVRQALGNDALVVTNWTYQPIYGGAGLLAHIYRIAGDAQAGEQVVPWSLILKISQTALGSPDPTHTRYWKREPLVYQSGFLEQLVDGLVAPRCYAVHEPTAGEAWIWLEELHDADGPRWSLERYGLAARHLGAFNGYYLTQELVPNAPWVSYQWIHAWLAQTESVMAQFAELLRQPLAQCFYPAEIAKAYQRLWGERERFLSAIDRLPQTLCHRDANRGNLFARRDPDGREHTVAIDWSDVGIGPLGQELASFVLSPAIFYKLDMVDLPHLDRIAFEGYLTGLRAAGWAGSAQLVRLGYTSAAFLRYGLGVIQFLPLFLDDQQRGLVEQSFGHPVKEVASHMVPINQFLLRLADEAQGLIDKWD